MSVALREAPLSPTCTEHELVARVRLGEERAFEELYIRYRRRIAAYVQGMVGDPGRAEEITQDVFLSAFRRMRDTERPIAFKPWIYEIAKNACIDNARRARHVREVPLEPDEEPGVELGLDGPTLEHTVAARQQLDDLRGAFGCLSESHHQILVLRELEGLSYQQIGERMGMSRPMVESTLFRARRRLSEEYEELVSGRRCEHVQTIVAMPGSQSLGLRERRRLARHLAHCQPCRRHAAGVGFDIAALKPRRGVTRVAGLLPLPFLRLPWRMRQLRGRASGREGGAIARLGSSPAVARSADAISSLPDPTLPSIGLSRAAAAVAAIAITGAGGGVFSTAPLGHRSGHQVLSAPSAQPAGRVSARATKLSLRSSQRGITRGTNTVSASSLQGPRTLSTAPSIPGDGDSPGLPTGSPPRQFGQTQPQSPVSTGGTPLRPPSGAPDSLSVPKVPTKIGLPTPAPGNPLPSSGVPIPKPGALALPHITLPHHKR